MMNLYQWPGMTLTVPSTVSAAVTLFVRNCSRNDHEAAAVGMKRNDANEIPGLPFKPPVLVFMIPNCSLLPLVWLFALTSSDRDSADPVVEKSQLRFVNIVVVSVL